MNFKKAIQTTTGKRIISILLGFGLASLFRKVCHDRSCLEFKAVTLSNIKDKVFKFDDKCYSFKETTVRCNPRKKILSL